MAFLSTILMCYLSNEILKPIIPRYNTRYYLLHALVNAYVAVSCFPDIIRVVTDPRNSLDTIDQGSGPLLVVMGIHMFHVLTNWKNLSLVEYQHHISAFILGIVFSWYFIGPIRNMTLFFLSGLPGGIDYLVLVLRDFGIVSRLTHKKIYMELNMWIRMPGIIWASCSGITYYYLVPEAQEYNRFIIFIVHFLNLFNGIYFSRQSAIRYGELRYSKLMYGTKVRDE